ncbi:MAG TPA: response regulator [Micropepsaceae bacterium]|jgi:YesN/AraC family two-component response regulator
MANILLVDDEALVVETLSNAMKNKGHSVVTASNGIEGLKRFGEGDCNLVITDIVMPDMDGMAMIMEIRHSAPAAKIIAISGGGRSGNVEFLKMAAKLGAMATLRKPIRLAEFFKTLDECLSERHGTAMAVLQS